MIYFLDASAVVKRYVREPGRDAVRALARRSLAASALSAVEVPAALWRRAREGGLTDRQARESSARVAADLTEMIVVEVRRAVMDLAVALVERHPLRAYDAVQLACAQLLTDRARTPVTFVCADRRLGRTAAVEGLRALHVG